MIQAPDEATLEALRARGYHSKILGRDIGPYHLSAIYRECSAVIESPIWYAEMAILKDRRMVWQGEGWGEFIFLANDLNSVEQIEAFLKAVAEDDD